MVNVARLEEELNFITRNPKHHDQGLWFQETPGNPCGTAGCLAGWTAIHHAKDKLESKEVERWSLNRGSRWVIEYEPLNDTTWFDLGAELLGIDEMQAEELFHESNTVFDLWYISNIITGGEIVIPAEVVVTRGDQYNRSDDDDFLWLVEE